MHDLMPARDATRETLRVPAFLLAILGLVGAFGCDGAGASSPLAAASESDRTPLEVVQARMKAYNRHDLEAFLAQYADDVEIRSYPDRSLGSGRERLRDIFGPMFEAGRVQVDVHYQATRDGFVVNHETVTDAGEATEYISIYEVRRGLIRSVCFVRD